MSATYTCITCRVMFIDGDTQRAHYKSDWHRYNLKRKVADLPPVTTDNFRQRVLNAQQTPVEEDKSTLGCKPCGKQFNSQKALENHGQSKKHRDMCAKASRTVGAVESKNRQNTAVQPAAGSGDQCVPEAGKGPDPEEDMDDAETDSDVESVDSFGDEDGLGIEECLFCSFVSASLEENTRHMTSTHSFFLPDAEYICDLEGLITYLGQKVGLGHMCLWCNEKGKSFHSSKSAQQHMQDKGHCKILHEGDVLLEYTDYYDYRSSYPDNKTTDQEGVDDEDVEVELDVLAEDGFELVLPSGSTIGHRSLHKYYKQNINPRSAERTKSMLPRMLAQYKALGWSGATGVIAERRCKDLAAVQRLKNHHFAKLGVKANKFQPHFRAQVMF